ncbi:hypothetical protein DSAG12_02518 [Promethearchaeum syntrophicum]|uniref:Uncharacterized protein n=1 Tax=Promethearchaeum syntrophicum TaxID=2594042 RepID=A0A5B9DBW7_9ARCH|nr:hypothetical protein [Candidatus Prometheoarchaeum syntrophicum]QEE16688.1 hypothetical protein DSAG12_02518 [Candidatus Prometheoarchaeum syntrophicum]
MPEGIFIIDWDEYEGGIISLKYPKDLDIPVNFVQLLQISHSFNPGIMNIKEEDFNGLSLGNEELQKVTVLILNKFEDAEDFKDILCLINDVVSKHFGDDLLEEIERLFKTSQSVFKAREAVLNKLANEVNSLKNTEIDIRQSMDWFIRHESDFPKKKILFILLRHGSLALEEIETYSNFSQENLLKYIEEMEKEQLIALKNGKYKSMIHYILE